jgi:hypothetical protein
VVRFLSDEWVAAMDRAANAAEGPRSGGGTVVVQHVVTDVPDDLAAGRDSERVYHLVLTPDSAAVRPGRADAPTVTFTATYTVAAAVARGERSAQAAFMAGELRLGGAVEALLGQHAALGEVADPFAAVRAETEF